MILTKAGEWFAGKVADIIAARLGKKLKPIALRNAVQEAVFAATDRAARRVGRFGANALADALIDETGDVLLRMLSERGEPISESEEFDDLERRFIANYPEKHDEGISPFSREEARAFLNSFLKALDDELWSSEMLGPLRASVSLRQVERTVGQLAEHVGSEVDPARILEQAVRASKTDLDRFWAALGKPPILLDRTLIHRKGEIDSRANEREILEQINSNWRGRLIAEPGAGKSTFLLAIAESVITKAALTVPVLLPLVQISHGQSVIGALTSRAAFHEVGIDEKGLRLLIGEYGVVLICDGWNELAAEERRVVTIELLSFLRDYPNVALLIATRPSISAPNFPTNEFIYLTPLTVEQQLDYVKGVRGEAGAEALRAVRSNVGLADLLQNPLFLSIFAEIDFSDDIPTDRESLIGRFVTAEESKPFNREALGAYFADTHRDYLIDIAAHLTSRGSTQAGLKELRPVVLRRARHLANAGQIADGLDPFDALDKLSSHTNLCRSIETPESVYRFQHQQFQEWFASHVVEVAVLNAFDRKARPPSSAAKEFVDRMQWEEAVLFCIERLSRGSSRHNGAAARLVLETLGVDPSFAARMIARADERVWKRVENNVCKFVRDWPSNNKREEILRFVVLSGRPEFQDIIWLFLSDDNYGYHRFDLSVGGSLDPRVLGGDWHSKTKQLNEEIRRLLVHDLAFDGGELGVDYVLQIAKEDPSDEIVCTVADALAFRGRGDLLEELLQGTRESIWERIVLSLEEDDFPSQQLKERRRSILRTLVNRETHPERRLQYKTSSRDKTVPKVNRSIRCVHSAHNKPCVMHSHQASRRAAHAINAG